ncbi:MAG TPA: D-2-hydroxyacid dehydrogenase [Dehalococcoidia bacterium]|nr:D-2-hydroxyacid dehydrogenase [Dehalococcoidia bacterium]
MPKFVFMPPQDELKEMFAARLSDTLPEYDVVSPETDQQAIEAIRDADAACGWIPPAALEAADKLTWLHNPDAGPFHGYYYPELLAHSLTMTNPRGIYFDHISHHILMFVMALSRGLPWYMDAQRQGVWDNAARKSPYIDLTVSTALINGVGGIGHETARILNELGMEVIGVDPRPEYELPFIQLHTPDELDEVLHRADFVITTVPHTPETEGMFNARRFELMKNSAYFINIGRGKVCKIDDLADAIENGVIAGAGLDVFEEEPLPSEHKLWGLPNVLMTPHVAVRDAENLPERRFQIILDNARKFLNGEPLNNVVDKDKWY